MSGSISFSGLSSGIDFDSLIDELVEAEKYQANQLEDWKTEWEEKIDLLSELRTKFSSLDSIMGKLSAASSFWKRNASSSNDEVATIAVDSSAQPGTYSIEVGSNIQHIYASRGYSSEDDIALNDVTEYFTISVGGTSIGTIDGTGGKTLEDIAAEIDALDSVSAEIINDGSSSNAYRIQITADDGGSANEITVSQTNTDIFSVGIDDVEVIDDEGGDTFTVNSGAGSYTGHVNKRFNFEVIEGGEIGTDEVKIKWTDEVEGRSGTMTISGAGSYGVTQGVQLTFAAGENYEEDALFAVDVFHNDYQRAQDSGLAAAEKEVHSGMSDRDTTPVTTTNATFSYSFAGRSIGSITVKAGTTLEELADLINEDANNPGVKATIVNDGTGAPNAYHLVLTSTKTGAANKIEDIDFSSFTGSAFASGSFSETQSASNAMVKLDGYPSGASYLQNSTNLYSDLIDGASVTIKSVGTAELSIENDVDTMVSLVQDFVDGYNDVMSYINEITAVDPDTTITVYDSDEDEEETNGSALLAGNYTIQLIESKLKTFLVTRAEGYEDGTDPYLLLSQLGISTSDDDLLEFDEDDLRDALNEDPESVVSYFSDNKVGVSDSSDVTFYSATSSTLPGTYHYKVIVDVTGNPTSGLLWKDGETEADAVSMTISGKTMTVMSGDAKGMAIELQNSAAGTYTGTMRVKYGKSHEFDDLMDDILNVEDGMIKVLEDSYENIIENIETKIARELDRVAIVEERYRTRFANLETALTDYNGQLAELQQQISTIPTIR